ncbi:MAG: FAD-binding oxidoreductase [SAR324 cluster bacterium]|nr:FAD-binding oxidoreductase [SAR324 cluster bacterium]
MSDVEIIIVGGGIAGASAAYELAIDHKVLLLEMEDQAGYHSTGRSAALFTENYGNSIIRKLAKISKSFLESPPDGFSEYPLLSKRGALFIARSDQLDVLNSELQTIQSMGGEVQKIEGDELLQYIPHLNREYAVAGIYDPHSKDIDVSGLHQGFLKEAKLRGGSILMGSRVLRLRPLADGWLVETEEEEFSCKILINAAGAWAEEIGVLAGAKKIALSPMKRTAFLFDVPEDWVVQNWPIAIDMEEKFYFKPDSGKLLGSPADETPVLPQDARPDDFDIAMGIERIQAALNFEIRHLSHKWAGLRSFVPDRTPVAGFDPVVKNFFWLAGQGGYGIKTSPALAVCCGALIREGCFPKFIEEFGLSAEMLSPKR